MNQNLLSCWQHAIKKLETSLRRDMKELEIQLEHDLTVRLGGMLVIGISVVATLVKLL